MVFSCLECNCSCSLKDLFFVAGLNKGLCRDCSSCFGMGCGSVDPQDMVNGEIYLLYRYPHGYVKARKIDNVVKLVVKGNFLIDKIRKVAIRRYTITDDAEEGEKRLLNIIPYIINSDHWMEIRENPLKNWKPYTVFK